MWIQKKCLLIRNIIRLPFTCFSIPVQNFSQQYKCFWKLKCTYGVLRCCETLLSLKGSVNVEWSACKLSLAKLYLKDNKYKVYSPGIFYCLNTDFSVRANTRISDVTGDFSALLPKQHWFCTFREVLEDVLLLFASKISHRKLNVLIFHRQVCFYFLGSCEKKKENTSLVLYFSQ